MKLFLSSIALSGAQASHLAKLVGKNAEDIRFGLIENGADGEAGSKNWVQRNRGMIQSHGFNVERVDLNEYADKRKSLKEKLASKDVIWVGGGNTYYLRWLLKDTGADKIIKELVGQGIVYGGGSAGAIVAGPTLKHFETADDPNKAPELILEGLQLTENVVVPHIDNEKYKSITHTIDIKLKADGYKTAPLMDTQAFIVNGDEEGYI